jgi:methyl-accepting chemotaxis protein
MTEKKNDDSTRNHGNEFASSGETESDHSNPQSGDAQASEEVTEKSVVFESSTDEQQQPSEKEMALPALHAKEVNSSSKSTNTRSGKRKSPQKSSAAKKKSPNPGLSTENKPRSNTAQRDTGLLKKITAYLNQIANGEIDGSIDFPAGIAEAKELKLALHRIMINTRDIKNGFDSITRGDFSFVHRFEQFGNGTGKRSERDCITPAFLSMVKTIDMRIRSNSEQFNSNFAKVFEINQSLAEMIHKVARSASETKLQAMAIDKKTSDVNAVSRHLTKEILTIKESAESSLGNIASVSTASEEMTATVSEIADNAEQARTIATDAVHAVDDASSEVLQLENAAVQISNVTETIMEIAEQTKLLALNATIEAARAGEAGKGFAVVAGEVKELAQQTNSATADIRNKIEAIQMATQHTISKIKKISEVMKDVDDFVSTIATATEEQTITTREITENLTRSSGFLSNVTNAVGELSKFAENMAQTIQNVTDDTTLIKNTSSKLSEVASELEKTETVLIQAISELN